MTGKHNRETKPVDIYVGKQLRKKDRKKKDPTSS